VLVGVRRSEQVALAELHWWEDLLALVQSLVREALVPAAACLFALRDPDRGLQDQCQLV
jgi:hypothetical protein